MFPLFKKELNYYLNNPVGYIVIILFAVFANFLFVKDIFVVGSASMRSFFELMPWLFLVFIPAIAMRSLSEEKRTNTIETLLTLPVSETQIVLAKFFALLSIVGIGLLLTFGLPLSLYVLTQSISVQIYLPEVFIGYIGVFLLGASFIAISMFFSSLTKNQVIAFLASVIVFFFLIILSTDMIASVLPKVVQDVLNYFSPMIQLQNFTKGLLDIRSIFYFLSTTVVFLFLTIVNLEKRD